MYFVLISRLCSRFIKHKLYGCLLFSTFPYLDGKDEADREKACPCATT
jgi:hypothetical protein